MQSPRPVTAIEKADIAVEERDTEREATRRLMDAVQRRDARDRKGALERALLNERIDLRLYEVGQAVQQLWERTCREPRLVASLEPRVSGGMDSPFERMVIGNADATELWLDLMSALPEDAFREVVNVCIRNQEPDDAANLRAGLQLLWRTGLRLT
jgi:hypothetical protein